MNTVNLKKQIELGNKAAKELQNQNAIFESLLNEALKNVPDEQKKEVQKIQLLCKKSISLAKSGKSEEAKNLIKNYNHGR